MKTIKLFFSVIAVIAISLFIGIPAIPYFALFGGLKGYVNFMDKLTYPILEKMPPL